MNCIPTTSHRDRIVRYTLLGSAVLTALLGAFVSSTADAAEAAPAAKSARPAAEQVARGKYLMSTSGCMDCHTPWKMGEKGPEPDLSRLYSGHPEQLQMPPLGTRIPDPQGQALLRAWLDDMTRSTSTTQETAP